MLPPRRPPIIVRPGPRIPTRTQNAALAVLLQARTHDEAATLIGCRIERIQQILYVLADRWGVQGTQAVLDYALEHNLVRLFHLERE